MSKEFDFERAVGTKAWAIAEGYISAGPYRSLLSTVASNAPKTPPRVGARRRFGGE